MEYIIFLFKMLLLAGFVVLAVYDWRKFRLPDRWQLISFMLITVIYLLSVTEWVTVLSGLLAGFVIGLIIYYFGLFFYKQQVFGFGDVKLLALIGYLSGIHYFLYVFLGGTVIATLYALTGIVIGRYNWKSRIPLGTFLCTAAIIFLIIY
jgi:Flp pilus assembly protein protease CpaA